MKWWNPTQLYGDYFVSHERSILMNQDDSWFMSAKETFTPLEVEQQFASEKLHFSSKERIVKTTVERQGCSNWWWWSSWTYSNWWLVDLWMLFLEFWTVWEISQAGLDWISESSTVTTSFFQTRKWCAWWSPWLGERNYSIHPSNPNWAWHILG